MFTSRLNSSSLSFSPTAVLRMTSCKVVDYGFVSLDVSNDIKDENHTLGAVSTRVFWSRSRARDGADLQMDALLCQINAKLRRTINLAQSRARSRARKSEQKTRVETTL
jgi:hypothetical protein